MHHKTYSSLGNKILQAADMLSKRRVSAIMARNNRDKNWMEERKKYQAHWRAFIYLCEELDMRIERSGDHELLNEEKNETRKRMKPGRELDLLVAEHVIGWRPNPEYIAPSGTYYHGYYWLDKNGVDREIPYYSTDISAAWEVAEKMIPWGVCIAHQKDLGWEAEIDGWIAEGESAPHAICKAALAAKGVDV